MLRSKSEDVSSLISSLADILLIPETTLDFFDTTVSPKKECIWNECVNERRKGSLVYFKRTISAIMLASFILPNGISLMLFKNYLAI